MTVNKSASRTITGAFILFAVVASLGSAPLIGETQPAKITLADGRILSLVGDYEFSGIADIHDIYTNYYGKKYLIWRDMLGLTFDMSVSEQKGKKVTIDSLNLGATAYGYAPGGLPTEGEVSLAKPAKAKIGMRRKVRKWKHYGHVYTDDETKMSLKSNLKFDDKTKVQLKADKEFWTPGFLYGGSTYGLDLGTTSPFWKEIVSTNLKGGLAKTMLGLKPNQRLRINGNLPLPAAGTLSVDLTWTTETKGTCIFTAPPHLVGQAGKVKCSKKGVITVTGPKGSAVKVIIKADGSGKASLGYGRWDVPEGTFQLQ
jgi:hypothetical protein